MNSYNTSQKVRLKGTFDVDGVLTDPATVTFKMRVPAGTITTYVYGTDSQLVREAAGVYYVDYTITNEGTHSYRFVGTGAVTAANEVQFQALGSAFQ